MVTEDHFRVGVILPIPSSSTQARTYVEIVAQSALMGTVLAAEDLENSPAEWPKVNLFLANAPTREVAERAAERLIAVERVVALIGGVGEGQAETLTRVANEHGVLFFNIGSTSDSLRGGECAPLSFHIEASESMYLDAIAQLYAPSSEVLWYFVHEDTSGGRRLFDQAAEAVSDNFQSQVEVGKVQLPPGQLVFTDALMEIERVEPDLVILLLEPMAQEAFLTQNELTGLPFPVVGVPYPATQTRYFLDSIRLSAPSTVERSPRLALWEANSGDGMAKALNERFLARWGEPMDPSAWAAYTAVKILAQAAREAGEGGPALLAEYLVSGEARFDVFKGWPASFRSWDHQLRHLFSVVRVRAQPGLDTGVARRVAIAEAIGTVPMRVATEENIEEVLDRFGDDPFETSCQFPVQP